MATKRSPFEALGHPLRRHILRSATSGMYRVSDLARFYPYASYSTINQHVQVLVECGVVSLYKFKNKNYVELVPAGLREITQWLQYFNYVLDLPVTIDPERHTWWSVRKGVLVYKLEQAKKWLRKMRHKVLKMSG